MKIRNLTLADETQWSQLYAQYREFYKYPVDPAAVKKTWQMVFGAQLGLTGLVAESEDGQLLGFAHVRWFARPLAGSVGLFLDDLFTSPVARGQGVARELLAATRAMAAERGATVVRWITAADNETARRVYDDVANATQWVTYDMAPSD